LFWPSLTPRHEGIISGRSPKYLAAFGGSLREKTETLGTTDIPDNEKTQQTEGNEGSKVVPN
jgi:hypothetical protein